MVISTLWQRWRFAFVLLVVSLFFLYFPIELASYATSRWFKRCAMVGERSRGPTKGISPHNKDLNSSDVCSTRTFRNYFRRRNYFPGGGRWVDFNSTISLAKFEPDLCIFRHDYPPYDYIDNCLMQRNINRIVTIGDSNGARYYDAILAMLKDGGFDCRMYSEERVDEVILRPDVGYYARVEPRAAAFLRPSFRHCFSCASRSHGCISPRKRNGSLGTEHLAMTSVLDSSLKLEIPHNHIVVNLRYRADTYQEYLLKYHLRRHVPDLLIVFPPFNHDRLSESVASLEIRLRYFVELIRLHLPQTTRLVWVPVFREFKNRKSIVGRNWKVHDMLPNSKMEEFNRALFRAIRPDLVRRNSSVYAFFDLMRLSENRDDWSFDGIHMHEEWYKKMASYLVQMLCSEEEGSAFDSYNRSVN